MTTRRRADRACAAAYASSTTGRRSKHERGGGRARYHCKAAEQRRGTRATPGATVPEARSGAARVPPRMAAIAPTEGASTAHVRAATWIGAQHACAAAATWTMAPLPVEDEVRRAHAQDRRATTARASDEWWGGGGRGCGGGSGWGLRRCGGRGGGIIGGGRNGTRERDPCDRHAA